MAKTTQVQDQTMEEILASIRRIISDDEARGAPVRPAVRPAASVSHLFAEPPSQAMSAKVVELPVEQFASARRGSEFRYDKAGVTESADDSPVEGPSAIPVVPRQAADREPSAPPRNTMRPSADQPLLSAHADAAVSSAFGNLAGTIDGAGRRSVEGLVEDMVRPMLKQWLDRNLPVMVERLVREEIERISTRQR